MKKFLWITSTIGITFGYLYYSGFCFPKMRYLTQDEMCTTIRNEMKHGLADALLSCSIEFGAFPLSGGYIGVKLWWDTKKKKKFYDNPSAFNYGFYSACGKWFRMH